MNSPDEHFRDLKVAGLGTVQVPKMLFPMLSEWDWFYDTEIGQPFRGPKNKRTLLYHEVIKETARRRDPDITYIPTYPSPDVIYIFGNQLAYWKARASHKACSKVLSEHSLTMPPLPILIGSFLTATLMLYYFWLMTGNKLIKGNTAEQLERVPQDKKYTTIGEWASSELSGGWDDNLQEPTTFEFKLAEIIGIELIGCIMHVSEISSTEAINACIEKNVDIFETFINEALMTLDEYALGETPDSI